jgi:carbonic anhydrase
MHHQIKLRRSVLTAAVAALGLGLGVSGFVAAPALAAEPAPHFCYDDNQHCGPSHWGELADAWYTCAAGTEQSPMDIRDADEEDDLSNIRFSWNPTPLKIKNNGHTLQVNYEPGSTMDVNGVTYNLLQFHFHTPSEHTIAGAAEPMEVHFVHVDALGTLAVVGVLMKGGAENHALQEILHNAPHEEGEVEVAGAMIDGNDFLPRNRNYYNYAGSLTTPPCSEGVRWHVLRGKITASHPQVEEFGHFVTDHLTGFIGNARPVQPLNAREVLESEAD